MREQLSRIRTAAENLTELIQPGGVCDPGANSAPRLQRKITELQDELWEAEDQVRTLEDELREVEKDLDRVQNAMSELDRTR